MTDLQIIFFIVFSVAIFEAVLQLSFVSWYFKNGIKIFTFSKNISQSINVLPSIEKYNAALKRSRQKNIFYFEEIDSDTIAMRFRLTPLSSFYGILNFSFRENILIQKVFVSWFLILLFIFLSVISFLQSLIFGLLSIIIFPLFIFLQFIIVKGRFKSVANVLANY